MNDSPVDEPEFYVGYDGTMPPRLARRTRRTVAVVLALMVAVAASLVWAQRPFAPSRFEFGTIRAFRGTVVTQPYPALLVPRPGHAPGLPDVSSYILVGPGKSGAAGLAAFDRAPVALEGTLVYRDEQTMIEVVSGSVHRDPAATSGAGAGGSPGTNVEDLGSARLVGEIVDSKCFLGVMNPGNLQVHRDCAVRCISGGVPPVLVVHDRRGALSYLILVSKRGLPVNQQVLAMIATPVAITGRVTRRGDQLFLAADPTTYELQ